MVIAGLLMSLFSCNDPEVEKQNLSDAFIISKIVDRDTIYSFGAYVSSNTVMKSVTMKSPDGSISVDLKKSDYYGYYFEKQIKNEDFTLIKPAVGKYKFEIIYGDATAFDTTDYVSSEILEPIAIKEFKYDPEYRSIEVGWVKNKNADYYILSFYRHDSIVYQSNSIDPSFSSVEIFEYTPSWYRNINPNSTDTLQIIVTGILCEGEYTPYADFQSISLSSKIDFVLSQ